MSANFELPATNEVSRVVVVGAGFAGLGAAVTLGHLGKQVTVLERGPNLAYGASITIVNRGPDALRDLGVLDQAIDAGIAAWDRSLYDDFFDASGNRRPTPPMPQREADDLPNYILIFRPDLAEILRKRAQEVGADIRVNSEAVAVTDNGDDVTVTLANGEHLSADLVIGADGWRSPIREQIFPNRVTSTYSGNMSLRWVMKNVPDGQDGFYVTDSSEVVVVHSLKRGMVYLATGLNMENRHVSDDEAYELARQALAGFSSPYIQELRGQLNPDIDIVVRPYVFHNLPAPWHRGRILVIGDAAHTMSAHVASGGVMALEDAVVLGQEMNQDVTLNEALLAFAQRRARRTFVAVDACRQMLDLQVNYQAPPRDLGRVRMAAFTELLTEY